MNNPFLLWERDHILTSTDLQEMEQAFERDMPTVGGFDTETTGLHIKKDKPFLIQFGWLVPNTNFGRVYTYEPKKEFMESFFRMARKLKYFIAHNIKYDIHMLSNIGYAEHVQSMTNLVDNMAVARIALEAIPEREGGAQYSLALKNLGRYWVHPDATKSESLIKDALRKLNAERIKVLSMALKQFPIEGELTATGKQKYWGKGVIEKFLKDPTHDVDDLPDGVRDVWLDWQEEYPEPTYADVDRDLMIKYGGEDIITMLEFFKKAYPYVVKRKQLDILKMESEVILPMYRMERVGLKVNMKYLEESRLRVKAYIKKLRNELHEIAGEVVTVNQHARIKQIFAEKWGMKLEASDNPALKQIKEGQAGRFSTLIRSLRSLEKWYSTYIKRIQQNASYDGRVYTQINSSGAVSGRMSSDLQQFPKKALRTIEGEELFHPRKAFVVKGEGYNQIVYIDYNQIELVTQAHYTILVSGGDINLCRAYMPFRCRHYQTGETYDFRSPSGRSRVYEKQPNGESAWLDEDGKPWVKTDLHTLTASKAYPDIPIDSEEFEKEYRPKGKTTNFASNYGGGPNALTGVLNISYEEAEQLVNGYNEAFPGVIIYQRGIERAHAKKGFVHNHYGRTYYLSNSRDAYKLANYVVQGSAADALKQAVIRLDQYLMDKKSSMVIPIHDEIQFDIHESEEWIIPELQKIMEEAFEWCLVPATAGVERTYTDWASAKED